MNPLLTRLGVPPEVQDFFQAGDDLVFRYGDSTEHFGEGFHRLPATENLWLAGTETASHVVVSFSAMEAIALVTLNRHLYPRLQQTAFVAIGSRLHDGQASWIRQHFPKRKFTLVFGKDLLGHLTAIKMAAGIRNVPVRIFHTGHQVAIYNDERELITSDERLSLHAFQEAFGLRPRFRTACARLALTFLDQLQTSRT